MALCCTDVFVDGAVPTRPSAQPFEGRGQIGGTDGGLRKVLGPFLAAWRPLWL